VSRKHPGGYSFGAPRTPGMPGLREGMRRMPLRHLHGEGITQAIERARRKPWWPRVTNERPVWSGGNWVWTLRPEAATGRTA
jgi:hypothetical protein